ncbi:gliding motility lipoprotein GldD [Nonlabens ponticola]|uniref:Gliding motility lipoprotein GldD n=1 Tax=Nonlabens ponticola TaxID=2496866 RepID=A0A3S9MVV5_9FLAO|nr:gliding motility lipoprotein GldD [Nonlabens ponticola]AZQ43272.1 gliding motility lipoprotein GldD [Nonlabens ponticola]
MHHSIKLIGFLLALVVMASCNDQDVLPKPDAMLALDYNQATYKNLKTDCPFSLQINEESNADPQPDCATVVNYPDIDATLFLNYRPVESNLRELLIDGQKLSYAHNQMADGITERPYVNPEQKVYGMLYEVQGNAASNAQFYVTDSVQHFLTASLYFNIEPNYDSILPALDYVQQDMIKMMESLQWKTNNNKNEN